MRFKVVIHQPILTEFDANSREEAWDILQDWLNNQIELIEINDKEQTVKSKLPCPDGGVHEFDQFDLDQQAEYGHCVKCGCWINMQTGENETKQLEEPFLGDLIETLCCC